MTKQTITKKFVFDKSNKTIEKLVNYFGLEETVVVPIYQFEEVDSIAKRVVQEFKLDINLNDLQLNASCMPDSFGGSSGLLSYYYFVFIIDDMLIFRGLDYIELIKALEERENNMPQLLQELLTVCMKHWKKDFKDKYDLLRTETIAWTTSVNQQMQVKFNQNEYFVFKLKCHCSYLTLVLMFAFRHINCTYREYRTLQITFEHFMFYINELASTIREKNDGELTSVDKLFGTADFNRISDYCSSQIYKTLDEFEGKCNLMVSLEFLQLCKNTVFVHLSSDRYEKFYHEV